MRIVIVGGGLVGETLAEKLSHDGHDISLVEQHAGTARALNERLDVQVIHGNGAKAPVLRAAGIEQAELVVATRAKIPPSQAPRPVWVMRPKIPA